jgi:hypothetical protein
MLPPDRSEYGKYITEINKRLNDSIESIPSEDK